MNVSVDPQIAIAIENVIDLEPIQKLIDDIAGQGLIQALVARESVVAVREQAEVTRELGAEFGDLAAEFVRSNRVILLVAAGAGVLFIMRKGK